MALVALLLLGLWCAGGVLLFRGLAHAAIARDRETLPAARAVMAETAETLRREAAMLARDPAVVDGAVKGDWATLARGASPRLTALTIDRIADILLIVDATGAPLVQVPATPRMSPDVAGHLAREGIRVVDNVAYVVSAAPIHADSGRAAGRVVVARRFGALAQRLGGLPARPGLVAFAGDRVVGTTVSDAPLDGWRAALAAGAVTIDGRPWRVSPFGHTGDVDVVLVRAAAGEDVERRRLTIWLVGSFAATIVGLAGGAWLISANTSSREAARARGRELEALSRVVRAMGGTQELPAVLTAALDAVRGVAEMDSGSVFRVDGDALVLAAHVALDDTTVARFQRVSRDGTHVGEALAAGHAMVSHPAVSPLLDAGVQTQMSLPILVEGRAWGVMALYATRDRRFSAEEVRLLEAVAGQIGLAIGRTQLLMERQQRSRRLEALVGLTQTLMTTLSLEEILQRVVDAAVEIFGSSIARLWLLEADGETLALRAAAGIEVPEPGVRTMRVGEGLTGTVAATRAPLVVRDPERDPRAVNVNRIRAEGVRSSAGVPMLIGDRLLGILWISLRHEHEYSTEELGVLQSMAAHAAVAVETARLFGRERDSRARLEALGEIDRELGAELDHARLLSLVVDRAGRFFQGECVIHLVEGRQLLVPCAWTPAALFDRRVPFGQGPVGTCAVERRGLLLNDYAASPHAQPQWVAAGCRRMMAHPLVVHDRLLGVIAVYRAGDPAPPFTDRDTALLEAFATRAAIALENAGLHESAERGRREAEELARVARTLTERLEVSAVGRRIVDSVFEVFTVRAAGLRLLMPDGTLVVVAWQGSGSDVFLPGHVEPSRAGFTGLAVTEGRTVWTRDVLDDPRAALDDARRTDVARAGHRALLAVPLRVKGRTVGALYLADDVVRDITPAEVALAETFADQAALALENARLYEEARESSDRLRALEQVNRLVSSSLQMDEVLRNAAVSVAQFLEAPYSSIWVLDEAGSRLRRSVTHGPGGTETLPEELALGQGLVGWSVEHRAPVLWADVSDDPRIAQPERLLAAGFRYAMAYPIQLGDRVLGGFVVLSPDARALTPETESLVRSLAGQAAVALDHARLFGEAQERLREATTLLAVGQALSEPAPIEERLRRVAREVGRALAVDVVAAYVTDAGTRELHPVAGYRVPPAFLRGGRARPFPIRDAPGLEAAWRDGRVIATPDLHADPRFAGADVGWLPPEALIFAPASVAGEPVGALFLVWLTPGREFRPAEIRLAEGVAGQMALAIKNAQLMRQTEERLHDTEVLLSVSRAVSSTLDLHAVLRHFLHNVTATLGADSASVWLSRDDPEWLEPIVGHHVPPDMLPVLNAARISLVKHAFYAEAATTRRPVLSTLGSDDPRLPEEFRRIPHRTQLFVPIVSKDRVIGGFALAWWEVVRDCAPGEIALMEAVASQAAVAVDNARLFEENRRQVEELSVLHELARAVTGQLDGRALVEALRSQVARVLDARNMVIAIRAGATTDIEVVLHLRDGQDNTPTIPVMPATGLLSVVMETGRAVRTDDHLGECARRGVPPFEPSSGYRHWLGAPLNAGGQVLGGIILRNAEHPFTEADERLLGNIADLAALAFGNARLFAASTRAYEELAATQEQLVRTQKLRALGEMASGVAHDFNNLLAAILGRAQLLMRHIEDPRLRQWAQVIERSALDGAQTVRRLQEFTHVRRDAPRVAVDLNAVVRDALELTESRWREEPPRYGFVIDVQTRLEAVPPVAGDPAELREVMTNLILNAVDAMPEGGTLSVATEAAGETVRLTVADTGVGMSPDVLERVFDPFFTTKGPQGTGLGLSTSYGILSRHGAEVAVKSEEGQGATFEISFPRLHGESADETAPAATPAASRSLRCLVIDDEYDVGAVIGDVLESAGHRALVVTNGPTALARLRGERFDAVFTDLAMPGMSGWAVAQAVRALDATLPVFMITGFGVEISDEERRRYGLAAVFPKPLDIPVILTRLAQLAAARDTKGESAP